MPMSFTPVIRTSKSIPRSLLEFSRDRGVDVKLLDFELLSDETLIKRADEQEYLLVEDLKDITEDDLKNQRLSSFKNTKYKSYLLEHQKAL